MVWGVTHSRPTPGFVLAALRDPGSPADQSQASYVCSSLASSASRPSNSIFQKDPGWTLLRLRQRL